MLATLERLERLLIWDAANTGCSLRGLTALISRELHTAPLRLGKRPEDINELHHALYV